MDIQEIKQLKEKTEKEINSILYSYYKLTGLRINSISIENIMTTNMNTGIEEILAQRSKINIEV